ncbi:MAG: hypothetical protein E7185_03275 [Erysipelotrichaceae bacterium]|nr:hypothetical protein [Erysipelotrichaceae bacterium]
MHNYPIYKNTRRDIIECATFLDDEICLKAYIKKEPSVVTYIDVANIHLKSDFDPDTTLIPGFTKRAVKYRDRDQIFVEICWNADESFTLRFPDEEVDVVRQTRSSFAFKKGDRTLATISRIRAKDSRQVGRETYETVYDTEAEEDISQQALYILWCFPILYFGF